MLEYKSHSLVYKLSYTVKFYVFFFRLFRKYCMMNKLDRNLVDFNYIGKEIFDFDMPMYLGMKNNDIIKGYLW